MKFQNFVLFPSSLCSLLLSLRFGLSQRHSSFVVAPIRLNTLGFLSLYLVDSKCSPPVSLVSSRGLIN
ncbi:hypothetical protein LINPERPRIM_LOCUS31194, partial [Linum perenne]